MPARNRCGGRFVKPLVFNHPTQKVVKHLRASSTLFNYDKRSHANSYKNNDAQLVENPDYGEDISDTAGGSIRNGSIPAGRLKTDMLR